MPKVWLPRQQRTLHNNANYYLLDSCGRNGGNGGNCFKFKELSWWQKDQNDTIIDNIGPPSNSCGKGDECVSICGEKNSLSRNVIRKFIINAGEDIMVLGGHYFPNLKFPTHIGQETEKLFSIAGEWIMEILNMNKKVTFVVFINDIHHKKSERDNFYRNYIIPEKIRKAIIGNERWRREVKVLILGQKKVCNMLVKEKRELLQNGKIQNGTFPGDYYVNLENQNFKLISSTESVTSGYMRCVQACSKLYSLCQLLGHSALLQFFPTCGYSSVETSLQVAQKIYDFKLPVCNVYKTKSCFR